MQILCPSGTLAAAIYFISRLSSQELASAQHTCLPSLHLVTPVLTMPYTDVATNLHPSHRSINIRTFLKLEVYL